jgi:hypothetical protein
LRKQWIGHLAARFGYGPEIVAPCFHAFWHARNRVELFELCGFLHVWPPCPV